MKNFTVALWAKVGNGLKNLSPLRGINSRTMHELILPEFFIAIKMIAILIPSHTHTADGQISHIIFFYPF